VVLLSGKLDTEIFGGIILSPHNRWAPFVGSVGVSGGNIEYVTPGRKEGVSATAQIDAGGKIVMPGLVNAHCHGDMTLGRGLGDDLTLQEQNSAFERSNWFYRYISDEDRYYSRQLTYCEALRFGTTFILENMYWGLDDSAKAMAQTGIKGALAQDIRPDFTKPEELLSEAALRDFADDCKAHGLIPVVGSISEEDFEPGLLRRIGAIVKSAGLLQTFHTAETTWRQDIVLSKYGDTSVSLLHKWGVLCENMICSHAVYLSDEEIKYLADSGAKVANTPLCEMKIADGIAPIPGYLKAGISVGLGTDGAMWNNSSDIFREMKGMGLLHTLNSGIRTLSTHDLLDMATIKGAALFGQEHRTGSLEPGKAADIILIDATGPHMTPLRIGHHENVASSVAFCATGSDVTDVFVGGSHVLKNRELTTLDLAALSAKVTRTSERLADKLYTEQAQKS